MGDMVSPQSKVPISVRLFPDSIVQNHRVPHVSSNATTFHEVAMMAFFEKNNGDQTAIQLFRHFHDKFQRARLFLLASCTLKRRALVREEEKAP
jgi:hypothetical protein